MGKVLGVLLCFVATSARSADLSQWTLEQKAGQLLLVGLRSLKQVSAIQPGGVVLFSWNMKDIDTTKKLTDSLHVVAARDLKVPLFIATDHEGGKVLRLRKGLTNFPDAAAIGSLQDPFTAFQVGKYMGRELAALGFNMNLAPVLDLGNAKSFLENRVWGEAPGAVGDLTASFIQGLESSRIFPVAKHFPGHGGTSTDSHFGLPQIKKSFAKVWEEDLEPFRRVIKQNVPGIMTAHVEIASIDGGPASLSKIFIQNILRDKMGYQGLVFTDDLEMAGVSPRAGATVEDLAMKALLAGTDMLLVVWSETAQEKIVERVVQAVKSGEVSERWLDDKVQRILAAKKEYLSTGNTDNPFWRDDLRRPESLELSSLISKRAIQWLAGQPTEILQALASDWSKSWQVVLPSLKAVASWREFRKQDQIYAQPSRPDYTESAKVQEILRGAGRRSAPLLVVTGPRASSSEEIFHVVMRELSVLGNDPKRTSAVLWVHQGLRPIEFRRDPASVKIGLLSLHSSSFASLSALMNFLKQETGH